MRFLHAADVHLDSPLLGLEKYDGAPVEAIRSATRRALENLVGLALSEEVDFVVFSGDLYDGDSPDYKAALFFVKQMTRLYQRGIPVVLISGNHDATSRITRRVSYPKNVHVLPADRPGTVPFDALRVAVHGQGYAQQAETHNLAANYPAPVSGFFNIGLLHTALDGREGHEPYAPCALAQLCAKGYDYWALGHVHRRESVNGFQYPRVEYPGNVQGRHIRETGPKGCLLVSVGPDGRAEPEFRAVDVFRWAILAVDVSGLESVEEAIHAAACFAEVLAQAENRPLAVRIELIGACPAHELIECSLTQVTMELRSRAMAESDGRLWVEKVRLRTSRPRLTQETDPALAKDAISEIRAAIAELRADPPLVSEMLKEGDCGALIKKLPPEYRWGPDALEFSSPDNLTNWLDRAESVLVAALRRSEDGR